MINYLIAMMDWMMEGLAMGALGEESMMIPAYVVAEPNVFEPWYGRA